MPKSLRDLTDSALRELGVLAVGENASSEDHAVTVENYESLKIHLASHRGAVVDWDDDDIPQQLFKPLARLLACEVANSFVQPAPLQPSVALIRVLAIIRPNDLGEAGALTEAQKQANKEAEYY